MEFSLLCASIHIFTVVHVTATSVNLMILDMVFYFSALVLFEMSGNLFNYLMF